MTVIDYRNPKAPDEVVEIVRAADGTVEIRVMPLSRPVAGRMGFAITTTLLVALIATTARYGAWKTAAVVAVMLGVAIYQRIQRVVSAHAAHRWIASPAGLSIERVSRGGYMTKRFMRRDTIGDVRPVQERTDPPVRYLRVKRISLWSFSSHHFYDLPNESLHTIATALSEGLGLPLLNDPIR